MTARQVYTRALSFINERNGVGAYHTDVSDFEKNAPEIINTIITLLMPSECIIRGKKIRDLDTPFEEIKSLDDTIPLHDALSSGVMPFYLASIMILEEDRERANYFQQLFRESEERVVRLYSSALHTSVKNVY
ncbi:MAG: hypothetical protein IJ323_06190 [Clostridia bacterium]|nr:hypothetical protein [Clostridia bacterium]